jgi:misacylated tRNA(Ala) deacylase
MVGDEPVTELLFREEPYTRSCEATVTAVSDAGIELDRTIFYPMGGGQPGDTGRLISVDGEIQIADTRKGDGPEGVVHVPAAGSPTAEPGMKFAAHIDWYRRHRIMRVHTCLHLLSALVPYPVTGGQISDTKGRLDFDIPEAIVDKETLTASLNELIENSASVASEWITDAELEAQPDLVKTMSVKPPTGVGTVRLIRIAGQDLQPCGGTHLANTGEIGAVVVSKIEKKGRQNRRVVVTLADLNPTYP